MADIKREETDRKGGVLGIKRDWTPLPHSSPGGNKTPLERTDFVFLVP